ncbi:MAG: rod shape-determining protein MreD [Bacteroidota bacterium]|nr:rod shape-determining protein MreD [Bacteroidota bacterium]
MIRLLPRNIARIIILVLLQVLLLDNINLMGSVNPYFYVLFVLLIPFETPGWLLLLTSFVLGITIDSFRDTLGLHTFATVAVAYLRPYVLQLISPRDGYEPGTFPRMYYYGFAWFLKYTTILVVIHHFILFFIEAFSFYDSMNTLVNAVFSSLFTITLILISQFFMYRK